MVKHMRVSVVGATGFIGRRLVESLCDEGVKVAAVSRHVSEESFRGCASGNIVPIVADLTDAASLEGVCADADVIFHLAGHAHASDVNEKSATLIHRQLTVEGTRSLLAQACRAGVKRFVFVSSVKAMGEGSEVCIDESTAATPVTEYGRAKLLAEQLVTAAGRNCGMHVSILRLPMVYGPGVKGNLMQMIAAIDCGRFPRLPEVDNRRSMVHIDDVVQALRLAVDNPKANGEVYIVTDGLVYSTYEIYMLIRRALGRADPKWTISTEILRALARVGDAVGRVCARPVPFHSIALRKLLGSAWYSSTKIERDLQFKPTQTFETALPTIVEEYRTSRWQNGRPTTVRRLLSQRRSSP